MPLLSFNTIDVTGVMIQVYLSNNLDINILMSLVSFNTADSIDHWRHWCHYSSVPFQKPWYQHFNVIGVIQYRWRHQFYYAGTP